MPGDDDVELTSVDLGAAGSGAAGAAGAGGDGAAGDGAAGAGAAGDGAAGAADSPADPAEQELRSLESSFAAVEEAMESLTRISADGGDGAVVVAQIEAVVNPTRFPLEIDPPA